MKIINHHGQKVKAKFCKVFPGRYSWQCSKCKNWNQSFEVTCPTCEWNEEHRLNPPFVISGGARIWDVPQDFLARHDLPEKDWKFHRTNDPTHTRPCGPYHLLGVHEEDLHGLHDV